MMKKFLLIAGIAAFIISCGDNSSKTTEPAAEKDLSSNPDYTKGLALVGKNDCFGCHKPTEAYTGPAYSEVAAKYAGQPGIVDTLAQRIIKGSSGHWGQAVMTPHPNLSPDDAKAMVKYVLLLNQ